MMKPDLGQGLEVAFGRFSFFIVPNEWLGEKCSKSVAKQSGSQKKKCGVLTFC
jgi:hypothetical protein